jgi:hypothetical protein
MPVPHGETPYIVEGRLGGDPPLTARVTLGAGHSAG